MGGSQHGQHRGKVASREQVTDLSLSTPLGLHGVSARQRAAPCTPKPAITTVPPFSCDDLPDTKFKFK